MFGLAQKGFWSVMVYWSVTAFSLVAKLRYAALHWVDRSIHWVRGLHSPIKPTPNMNSPNARVSGKGGLVSPYKLPKPNPVTLIFLLSLLLMVSNAHETLCQAAGNGECG